MYHRPPVITDPVDVRNFDVEIESPGLTSSRGSAGGDGTCFHRMIGFPAGTHGVILSTRGPGIMKSPNRFTVQLESGKTVAVDGEVKG